MLDRSSCGVDFLFFILFFSLILIFFLFFVLGIVWKNSARPLHIPGGSRDWSYGARFNLNFIPMIKAKKVRLSKKKTTKRLKKVVRQCRWWKDLFTIFLPPRIFPPAVTWKSRASRSPWLSSSWWWWGVPSPWQGRERRRVRRLRGGSMASVTSSRLTWSERRRGWGRSRKRGRKPQ